MNTRRIETKLREFAALPGLTTDQAEQLSDILGILAENEVDNGAVNDWKAGTAVDTGIAVSAISLSASDIVALEKRHGDAVDADIERKRRIANVVIAGASALAVTALTGGTGSAVAGSALSALKAIQTTR
jgi:hypothetical protein